MNNCDIGSNCDAGRSTFRKSSASQMNRVSTTPENSMSLECLNIDSLPTGLEVVHAIRSLKCGKAPGVNLITTGILKARRRATG